MYLIKDFLFSNNRQASWPKYALTLALVIVASIVRPTLAADTSCQGDCVAIGEWDLSLSLGAGMRSNPVLGQDDVPFVVVPKFSYYGKRFFLDSYDAGYTLLDRKHHQFNAILITPGFEQAFFSDWQLTNQDLGDTGSTHTLHKRRTAGLSGFEYTYIHPLFDWQTQLFQDVTGVHHGQKLRTALTFPWLKNSHAWELAAGATWQSNNLVNYYYGVRGNEVNNANFVYDAPATTSAYIKAEWETRFNKHWGARAVTSYKWLGSGVTNSPIVIGDSVFTFYAAGVYHF